MPGPNPLPPVKRRAAWKFRLLALAFGGAVAFLLLEGGLRVAEALRVKGADEWPASMITNNEYWAIYDKDLGYRQNPKFGDMNSLGMRDHQIGPKGDAFRVLFLGDSVAVYGDTVDDTFPGHIRRTFKADGVPDRVQVINAAVKGYTNYQELLLLKKVGLELKPDLVGFEFCLNDLFKFLSSFTVDANGQLQPGSYGFSTEAVVHTPDGFWLGLAKHSYVLVWLNRHLRTVRNSAAYEVHGGYSFDYRTDVQRAWSDKPWAMIEQQLGEAQALGREHGFPVFVVGFPLGSQYDATYLAKDRDYVLKPQRKLREICERLQIPCYDLYPDLSGAAFKKEDPVHLTPEGRQKAGAAIAKFLEGSGLLPK